MRADLKWLLILHVLLMVYSMSGIFSKMAADVEVFSLEFCMLYAGVLMTLGIYAIGWQQILKRMPLTTAFSNKAVTVVWGIIWGLVFFAEPINVTKIIGAIIIIIGVVMFSHADAKDLKDELPKDATVTADE